MIRDGEIYGYVYCLRNPLDGNKIFYVGSTTDIVRRIRHHVSGAPNNNPHKEAVVKSIIAGGGELIVDILEAIYVNDLFLVKEMLLDREKDWIRILSVHTVLTNTQGLELPLIIRNCKHCGSPMESFKGKRPKIYCNPNCKQRHWQASNRYKLFTN